MPKARRTSKSSPTSRRNSPADAPITPLQLPPDVRTVVVFGGSFDPPHFYHTVGPLSVVGRLFGQTGWLLYVPAAASPLKESGHRATDTHRLAMLKRALDIPARRSIWTDELDRAAWLRQHGRKPVASFTIDSLQRLRQVVPSRVSLRLLIGSDQAALFHKWKDARKIIEIAEPVVMVREPIVMPCSLWSALDDFWTREEKVQWIKRLAPNFPLTSASTDVRASILGAPRDVQKWDKKKNLDNIVSSVAQYIVDHNLYGFRPGPAKPADAEATASRVIDGDGPVGKAVMNRVPLLLAESFVSLSQDMAKDVIRQVKRANATSKKKPAPKRKRA